MNIALYRKQITEGLEALELVEKVTWFDNLCALDINYNLWKDPTSAQETIANLWDCFNSPMVELKESDRQKRGAWIKEQGEYTKILENNWLRNNFLNHGPGQVHFLTQDFRGNNSKLQTMIEEAQKALPTNQETKAKDRLPKIQEYQQKLWEILIYLEKLQIEGIDPPKKPILEYQ